MTDKTADNPELLPAAMDHHRRGDLAGAALLYDQFLIAWPEHPQALRLRGVLAREAGQLDDSLNLLARACEAEPADPVALNELALSCLAAGDLGAAERALRASLIHDPASLRALANLGALSQYRGRLIEAIDCYRRALALAPEDLEIHCNLAGALVDAGFGDQALGECAAALELSPGHPYVLAAQGAVLVSLERFGDALPVLEQAIGRNPGDDMALINLAHACHRLGNVDESLRLLRRASRANPNNARAVADLAWLLTTTGQAAGALPVCREFLARHPGERLVLAAHAAALLESGNVDDAAVLLDYPRLLQVEDVSAPQGYSSLEAFHAELADAVLNNPSLLAEPASKSTRGGRQTGELELAATPALAALGGLFTEAVERYVQRLRGEGLASHAVMAYAAPALTYRAWGTLLEGGGHQAPHLHPLGFLSGVYYVGLPSDMGAAGAHAGWLEFGRPAERFAQALRPAVRLVEPRPGRLVLFPSYFLHRTLPFSSAEARISIAFDAVPKGA